ncbi:hypothetical protein GCM10011594_14580 [Nakamurella endophytica]|uniref:Uncharacterized protein n=1 Tax=Nakamurella endophytica TaxID=1748367 RepID=A0A917STA7_9ACTN|nr:hypothetical protein GCM10011594_14580 [Nakamurella endophytica]
MLYRTVRTGMARPVVLPATTASAGAVPTSALVMAGTLGAVDPAGAAAGAGPAEQAASEASAPAAAMARTEVRKERITEGSIYRT